MNKWQRKAIALAKLAEDQRGKPEGKVAEQKLLEILNKHPEAKYFEPLVQRIERITMADLGEIKRGGGNIDGTWEGNSLDEVLAAMMADYSNRLKAVRSRRLT